MKGQKRPFSLKLYRRYIMKRLLSSILIIMTLSSASYAAATKTEIIEEEVCHAVAGCWINPKTGECPDCVIETRKIVTEIKEEKESRVDTYAEPAVVEKKKKILDKFFLNGNKGCTVLVAEKPRSCDWKMGAVKKRASKKCGGFDNWTWTNDTYTEYECKG